VGSLDQKLRPRKVEFKKALKRGKTISGVNYGLGGIRNMQRQDIVRKRRQRYEKKSRNITAIDKVERAQREGKKEKGIKGKERGDRVEDVGEGLTTRKKKRRGADGSKKCLDKP